MAIVFGSLAACCALVPLLIGLPWQHFFPTSTYKLFGVFRFVDTLAISLFGTCCAGMLLSIRK